MLRRLPLRALALAHRLPTTPISASSTAYFHRQCSLFSSSSSSQIPDNNVIQRLGHEEDVLNPPDCVTRLDCVSIDRSGLCNPPEHSHEPSSDSELVKHFKGIIKYRGGPISVAEYMEEVLTNPKAGLYINRDVFGAEGDFITSPEMVGVWAMRLWEQMGRPDKVNLVELGPGRGTVMADLLRGASKLRNFTDSLHVHIVKCSPALQKLQHSALKCRDEDNKADGVEKSSVSTLAGTPVSWHPTLEQVPSGLPTILIAHEFFDALPVYQFQRTSRGWYEKMVDVAEGSKFKFVPSPEPTPATIFLMKRYKYSSNEEIANVDQIEICPKGMELTQTITRRISSDGGGALIIDYGLNGVVSDSLQAIRKHTFVDILDNPGSADLSAYVDFSSIRHAAKDISGDVAVYGPMTQSQFLGSLGINSRVQALLENSTDEQAEALRTGYWRLVGEDKAPFWEGPDEDAPIGMRTRYMAMANVNKKHSVPVPFL